MALIHRNQGGSILAAVIILGTVLAIAGLAVVIVAGNTSNQSEAYRQDAHKVIVTEAGLRLALGSIKAAGTITASTYNVPVVNGEAVTINVTPNSATKGWVRSTLVVPTPSAQLPMVWSQMVKCSVEVIGSAGLDSLAIYNRTDSAIVLTFP